MNDGIDPEDFSLQYIRIDQFISMVSQYGQGALMAKFDVEAAYRNIAVPASSDDGAWGVWGWRLPVLSSHRPLLLQAHWRMVWWWAVTGLPW